MYVCSTSLEVFYIGILCINFFHTQLLPSMVTLKSLKLECVHFFYDKPEFGHALTSLSRLEVGFVHQRITHVHAC